MAGVAVLTGQADVRAEGAAGAEELIQPAGVGFVAEPEEDPKRNSLSDELPAPDRQWGDADAAPDQNCSCRVWIDLLRGRERVAQGTGHPDLLSCLQLAEPVGARAHSLDEEIEPDAVFRWRGLSHRDGSRQIGPAPPLPPAA